MTDGELTLTASDGTGSVRVEVAARHGGRLRQITVERDGVAADLLTTSPVDAPASSTGWGSFPMAPWAGRIRHGRFRFRGDDIRLALNHSDSSGGGGGSIDPPRPPPDESVVGDDDVHDHAIHGTTFSRPWTVVDRGPSGCVMTCALTGALDWPYRGAATQRISVHPDRLELAMEVVADTGSVFPASIGWHPWFAKPGRIEFRPLAMYALDAIEMPTGELVLPSPAPWDNCFVNHGAVRLHYERDVAAAVTVASDADHWVVYDLPTDAACVEPQTGPPDSPNIRPTVVAPGHPIRLAMTIGW